MRSFDPVVQALVCSMIRAGRKIPDGLEIATQLVRYHDTGFAEPVDQLCQKSPCFLGVPLRLNKNIQHVAARVDRPPEPVFSAYDRDDHLIQVPFSACGRSVAPDATGEVDPKTVYPFPDRFPADHHAPIGENIFDIRRAEREAMVDPDRICDDLTRRTVAFQARHGGRYIHSRRLAKHRSANRHRQVVDVQSCWR